MNALRTRSGAKAKIIHRGGYVKETSGFLRAYFVWAVRQQATREAERVTQGYFLIHKIKNYYFSRAHGQGVFLTIEGE